MCTIEIPDDVMKQAGWRDSHAVAVEVACRLYDAGVITLHAALSISRLERTVFWEELLRRGLPWMRVEADDHWEEEKQSLRKLGWDS